MTYKRVEKTRPDNATQYSIGDVVGDTSSVWTFDGLSLRSAEMLLTNLQLMIHATAVPSGMGGFKQYFFSGEPDAIADNAAFTLTSTGDKDKYTGIFAQFGTPVLTGAGLLVATFQGFNQQIPVGFDANGGKYYSRLVTDAVYTPVALSKYVLINAGLSVA